ncbi:hypothetical protein [Halobacteriovorax sp. JY17]|uniref:hypothetical protein n=1 Tax=Halobacteriovorax sp. JY17 TaxID=2014617 RepID=UPI000C3CD9D2|nr:hypothetical protein [Halobacteriovorax sp. JY17]PIK16270.1 MAG: hypothetical protein CES88_05905 [Halobacteriovorax sp. JY17]
MKVLTLLLILSLDIRAESASARATMQVNTLAEIQISIKKKRELTIDSSGIRVAPNQMILIHSTNGTMTRSSGKKGILKTPQNKKIEIFF